MEAVTNVVKTDLSNVVLITGSGRSGTRWLSHLFKAAGARSTHESLFTPMGLSNPAPAKWRIDSSWLGVPWINHNVTNDPELFGLHIAHVVRNPLDSIGSLISARVFEVDDPYKQAAGSVITLTGNVVYDTTNWWIQSNRIAAKYSGVGTVRLEDQVDKHWMAGVVRMLGAILPLGIAKAALWQCSGRDENRPGRRGGDPIRLTWGNIPEELRWVVQEMADGYGYPV